jgi:hypothetical protein
MPKTSYIRFVCKAGYKLNTDLSKLTITLNVTDFRLSKFPSRNKKELFRNAIINTRVKNFKISNIIF